MRTNFDFLTQDPQFASFAEAAVSAEMALPVAPLFVRRRLPDSAGICREVDIQRR